MTNYNNRKGKLVKTIAAVLCGVLCLMAVAGAGTALYMGGKNNGWFDKTEDETEQVEETSSGGAIITEGESNGIKLTSAVIAAEEYESYGISAASVESAYTIVASYNSGATNPTFAWTKAGGSDMSNVTITPSSDTLSCVVTCSAAFGTQIVITCASADNSSVKATCTVDYVKRITSMTFAMSNNGALASIDIEFASTSDDLGLTTTNCLNAELKTYASDYYSYGIVTKLGTGTINPVIKTIYIDLQSNINSGFSSPFASSTVEETRTGDNTYVACMSGSFSWEDFYDGFFEDIIDGDEVIGTTAQINSIYETLNTYYEAGSAVGYFELSFTDTLSGTEYTETFPVYVNPSKLYSEVNSLTITPNEIYF